MNDQKEKDSAGASMVAAARYMGMAFMIPMGALAGWIAGKFLDSKLHTTYWITICLLLGIAGGFIQVIREVQRDLKKNHP
jgi:uncharacterized protein YneF (UPF0154 family)